MARQSFKTIIKKLAVFISGSVVLLPLGQGILGGFVFQVFEFFGQCVPFGFEFSDTGE